MPKPRKPESPVVRTTVELPPELWRRAKIRAMDERKDLRAVIMAALEAYLQQRRKRRKGDAS